MKHLKLITAAGLLLLCTACAAQPAAVPENIEQVSEQKYTCTFAGSKYEFITGFPEKTKNAPLILMLHGYGDTAGGFRSGVHLETEANPLGYAVVYVSGGSGWNSGIGAEERPDQEFLISLVQYLEDTYGFDSRRTYAVGFSNGAFMVHRLAVEAGSCFEGCVSVAGLMPERIWNARGDVKPVSFFQITGEKDAVVPKKSNGSAEHTKDPAIEDVMDFYVQTGGLKLAGEQAIGSGSILKKYEKGKRQVWDLTVANGAHGWLFSEIDTNDLVMEFLEAQK